MSSFSIPDIPPKIELNKGSVDAVSGAALSPHTGAVQFAVNNSAGEIIDGKLSVLTDGQAKPEWFAIDGDVQRDFGTSGSETVKVNVSVPADVAQGDYSFRLQVAAVTDPDNEFAISPSTAFTVPAAEKKGGQKKSKWWLWLLLGLLALAIIGGVVWALWPEPKKIDPPKETATAEPTTAVVPKLEGKTLDDARQLAAEFKLIEQEGPVSGNPPNTVVSQNPGAETTLNKGFPVTVTYDPGISVPDLSGLTLADATNRILGAGLTQGQVEIRCVTSGVSDRIVGQNPDRGTRVEGKRVVTVVLSRLQTPLIPCRRRFIDIREATKLPMAQSRPVLKNETFERARVGM